MGSKNKTDRKEANMKLTEEQVELIKTMIIEPRNLNNCYETTGVSPAAVKNMVKNGRGLITLVELVLNYCKDLQDTINQTINDTAA